MIFNNADYKKNITLLLYILASNMKKVQILIVKIMKYLGINRSKYV